MFWEGDEPLVDKVMQRLDTDLGLPRPNKMHAQIIRCALQFQFQLQLQLQLHAARPLLAVGIPCASRARELRTRSSARARGLLGCNGGRGQQVPRFGMPS